MPKDQRAEPTEDDEYDDHDEHELFRRIYVWCMSWPFRYLMLIWDTADDSIPMGRRIWNGTMLVVIPVLVVATILAVIGALVRLI